MSSTAQSAVCKASRVPGSSAEGMQVHLHLLAAAQHPHGGVQAPRRDDHLPPAHELPIPREKHLQGIKQLKHKHTREPFADGALE